MAQAVRRGKVVAPNAPKPEHEPVQILHRPPDLRRRAVAADAPRGPDRACACCRSPSIRRSCRPRSSCARNYPGANPKVIAETVATPLEESINGVEGMLYMGSQATTDGRMTLTVTFKLGTDPDKAQQLVQNRVAQAEPRLPEEVRRLGVTTVKGATDLTMVVHLVSPNERYDMTYLRNYAVLNVKDRLARIDGVGQVLLFGSGDYSMRVWLDPRKVAERGLSAGDVVRAIREQNVQAAAGVVGASPGLPGVDLQLSINAQGRLQTEEEFGDIIVKTDAGRRGHAAARRRAPRARRLRIRAALAARQQARGGGADLRRAQLQRAPDLRQRPRDDGRDQEDHARGRGLPDRLRPDAVRARLDQGGGARRCSRRSLLVVLVVILFLQTWRASIIPLLAVPVSIDRHVRGAVPLRLLDQRADALRAGARHRHRRGRRDRRGGERRAQHRGGALAARRHLSRDARGLRARSSRSRWCWSPCSCRSPSSAGSRASSTSSSR